jgi:hypothetical protein
MKTIDEQIESIRPRNGYIIESGIDICLVLNCFISREMISLFPCQPGFVTEGFKDILAA